MSQTYTDRIFVYLEHTLSQPVKCVGCGGNGYTPSEYMNEHTQKKTIYYNTCKACKGACRIPTEQWVLLDALTPDKNRPKFIVVVKRYIDEHPNGKRVEFNKDYTKIRRI